MQGSRMSLPTQMAIGMVLGIAAGALTPAMGLDPSWYKPVGQLFINLVRMVVVPLVQTTLVAGAASVGDVSKLGRVAGKTLAYYLVTTAVAVVHRPRARQHLPARQRAVHFHGRPQGQGCRPAHARRRVPEHRPDQPH